MTYSLGRVVDHDEASLAHPAAQAAVQRSVLWGHHAPILDQGQVCSCTGNATAQLINTDYFAASRPHGYLTEPDAVQLYQMATLLDGIPDNTYPPNDDGSSGLGAAKAGVQLGYFPAYTHSFGFDHFAATLQLQPVIVGTDWYECVVPDTRVLTTDLEWLPAHKIDPGMQLVGFDENVNRSCAYRRATVISNDRIVRPCVEIETDRGTITASASHLFVQRHEKAARHWQRADQLRPGDQILYFGDPWEQDRSWEAGWLAGFYDGEGSLAGIVNSRSSYLLTCAQKVGPTLDFCLRLLDAKGYDYGLKINRQTDVRHWYLRGENAKCRFLGEIRPQRLLAVSERAWEGFGVMRNNAPAATVQNVRSVGDLEVMAIGTSTGTLITDGYLSHNSMFNPDPTGFVHPTGQVEGGHEYLALGISWETKTLTFLNSWSDSWGQGGRFYVTFDDFTTLLNSQGDATAPLPKAAAQ